MGEENCPSCCMCCEAVCCSGLSVSSTKFAMMDKYNLGLDDGDARLIHCNNCLQLAGESVNDNNVFGSHG